MKLKKRINHNLISKRYKIKISKDMGVVLNQMFWEFWMQLNEYLLKT